jgi:hypothetical protein
MRRVLIAAAPAFLLLQGCSLRLQGAPSEREFRQAQAGKPYIADPARAEAILSGARNIKICSRASDVRRLMGEPDFGAVTYDSNGNHNAALWTYLIDEMPASGGPRHAVEVTVNAARDVIDISVFTGSEAYISLVTDGPGCHSR